MEVMAMVGMLPPMPWDIDDMLDMLVMLVPMELTLMLEHMVPTTLARDLLMLNPRLMLMPTMVPMDTVPMVLLLMLVLMMVTTLARGLLMLSPRLMLMPTMVPMDTLHMVLLLMPILDTVDILDIVHMLDTHTLMVPTLPTVVIAISDKKEASILCSMNNNNFTQKLYM